ncbi:MAG: VPLPA-CTERM sorting domain-containing protein [Pseudomonadota bacterium]
MHILKSLAFASAMVITAGIAQATTVSFGGAASNDLGTSVDCSVFSAGCSDFTVTASSRGLLNDSAAVSRRGNGIGVNAPGGILGFPIPDLQPGELDGFPSPSAEALTFTFDSQVTVTQLILARLNSGSDTDDEYDLFVDGGVFIDNGTQRVLNGAVTLTQFTIAAIGGDASNDQNGFFGIGAQFDDFRVKSITYEGVSAIPLPASSLLLLAGLAGLAALRRRKTA